MTHTHTYGKTTISFLITGQQNSSPPYNIFIYWVSSTPAHWLNAWYTNIRIQYTYKNDSITITRICRCTCIATCAGENFHWKLGLFYPSPYAVRRRYNFSLRFYGGKCGQKGHLSQVIIQVFFFASENSQMIVTELQYSARNINFVRYIVYMCPVNERIRKPQIEMIFPSIYVSVFIMYLSVLCTQWTFAGCTVKEYVPGRAKLGVFLRSLVHVLFFTLLWNILFVVKISQVCN